jgi:phage/conjugal plasmid C-4 type zinc finger TraR family protein
MEEIESFQHSNIEEAEMGQLLALHLNMNAEAAVRARIKTGPSLAECEECGEPIPEARQKAVAGCTTCIHCQSMLEKR